MPSSKETLGTGRVGEYEFEVERRSWWKEDPHNPRTETTMRIFRRFTWNGEQRKSYELPTGTNGHTLLMAILDKVSDITSGRTPVANESTSASFEEDDIAF